MINRNQFSQFKGKILENEKLAPLVAYQIGGPAEILLVPNDEKDIEYAVKVCRENSIPLTVIGAGSNLLIRDRGILGAVLFLGPNFIHASIKKVSEDENSVLLEIPSFASKSSLIDYSLKHNLSGAEFSAGIPGTLGGAVYMNAGTKWGSYSEIIEKVKFYQFEKGFFEKPINELGLKYRGHGEGLFTDGTIVVSVYVRLKKEKSIDPVKSKIDEILEYRGGKQPLELPNCGSVFKNPENSRRGAGRLIEAANLKGTVIGAAQVSLKHANFILNLGGASSEDVEALIKLIQVKIKEDFGISLETEVIVLGEK